MKTVLSFVSALVILGGFANPCGSTEPLKVMSYNIHIASPPSKPDYSHKDLQAVADVIRRTSPDIVGLQEVDKYTVRSGKQSHQAKDLAESTGMHYHFASASYKSDGEQGQAILSRYPILKAESHRLPAPQGASGETRSLAIVLVEIEGTKVAFMTVHLDHRSDTIRKFQIETLLKHTQRYEEYPVILGGDFNMEPDDENFRLLKSQFGMLTEAHPLTYPQRNPQKAIDLILWNKKAAETLSVEAYYTVEERYASDHLPLVAELTFRQDTSPE
ncbi:endonuclease/exonuclease/phosphatase family protein [Roseimaritima sediminicola]|uniref:endonuclease/exonuclease/phosphatase family protein n=1 Tax=Roseimaritima sediminicola TaxID=2662066 RepID=UPI00129842A6|nr:endonuclease/exonuclease/phosphatase family protein [Roseimaritima sediminicola]